MKLFFLFLKDLRILKRDPKTVFLILMGPLLIMIVIGLIFSSSSQPELEQMSAIRVGVCDQDQSEFSGKFTEFISKNFEAVIPESGECDQQLRIELNEGRLMALVSIPLGYQEGIEKGEQKRINITVNDGHPQLAMILTSVMDGYIGKTSENISIEFVKATWINLDYMADNLTGLEESLDDTKSEFASLKDEMNRVSEDMDNIDVDSMKYRLNNAVENVEDTEVEINTYRADVERYLEDVNEMQVYISDASSTLDQTDSDLIQTRNDLVQTRSDLQQSYNDGECWEASNPPYTGDPSIDEYINRWVALCNDLEDAINNIDALIIDVDNHRDNIDDLQDDLSNSQKKIDEIENELIYLKNSLSDTSDIDDMKNSFAYMQETMDELELTKANSQQTLANAETLLDSTLGNIDSLKDSAKNSSTMLETLTSRDETSVVSPIALNTHKLFGNFRNIDAFFPAVLSIIVMFVSVLFAAVTVIREKQRGTLHRLKMAPVNTFWFVFGKILVTLLIASFQVVILFGIALVLFQVRLNMIMIPAAFIVACMLAMTSAAIGMMIASASKTENTAILASLVICLPLMFLSGVFFPWELMLPMMRTVSLLSPLTSAVNVLNSLLIYSDKGFDLVNVLLSSSYLVLWSIVSTVISTLLLKIQNKD
ncbi:ABC transporter permease [archaeon]|nr:ABC transporter permease [archaeon]